MDDKQGDCYFCASHAEIALDKLQRQTLVAYSTSNAGTKVWLVNSRRLMSRNEFCHREKLRNQRKVSAF